MFFSLVSNIINAIIVLQYCYYCEFKYIKFVIIILHKLNHINYYTIYYLIHTIQMLSKADKYRQMIQKATKRMRFFSHADNEEKQSTSTLKCNIKLPSHSFRTSQQIENNIPVNSHINHQQLQQYPTSLNNWPKSCIGLVLCEHHQNNQTYYVYGTGILIHRKIVLTSIQNVYCHRLKRQYTNIRFIVGVCGDQYSEIYDIMRVHYQKEYNMHEYDNYNFAVLQLYDDLSVSCGYVGWKTFENIERDEKYTVYRYTNGEEGSFNLRQITKHNKQQQYIEPCLGSGVLIKENNDKYYIVGLQHFKRKDFLSERLKNMINQWTEQTYIRLFNNNIGAQGCKYLSQTNWEHLTTINLSYNNIGAQGCKYLSQVNWIRLTQIYLYINNIDAQACKYLSQASWPHLTQINLFGNNIDAQGCKYMSQANWTHLNTIYLYDNNIDAQGCKYLSQAKWTYLTKINLSINNVGAQGCKYLSQANWKHLTKINLDRNNINAIIYRLLLQQSYPNTTISI